jgi:hypothetical protein
MTRTMYDSIRAANIKRNIDNPQMVGGYVDEYSIPKWTAAEWAMFPNAVKVRIAKKASTNDGHVLDVEPKLATPQQAPGWVEMRRGAGLSTPAIYVQKSTWAQVQQEFRNQGVAQPLYWIAHYNGDPTLPTLNGIEAVAKQYLGDTNGMDYSSVADYWPGVDLEPVDHSKDDDHTIASTSGELMERKTLTKSSNTTSVRFWLPGTNGTAIIVRPRIGDNGFAEWPVFLGDIFAWGNDKQGIGTKYNPNLIPGYDKRLESHRRIELPGAVWADFYYSCNSDFEVDIVG